MNPLRVALQEYDPALSGDISVSMSLLETMPPLEFVRVGV